MSLLESQGFYISMAILANKCISVGENVSFFSCSYNIRHNLFGHFYRFQKCSRVDIKVVKDWLEVDIFLFRLNSGDI